MDLRDHDRVCEHGFRMMHSWDCPGGAVLITDYDAATVSLEAWEGPSTWNEHIAKEIVDAALGVVKV